MGLWWARIESFPNLNDCIAPPQAWIKPVETKNVPLGVQDLL